jgi:S1-C subfamily serine protease
VKQTNYNANELIITQNLFFVFELKSEKNRRTVSMNASVTIYSLQNYNGNAHVIMGGTEAADLNASYRIRLHGQFGPSDWFPNPRPNVQAVQHTTNARMWIFGVIVDSSSENQYTKMIGVTLDDDGFESTTQSRQARYTRDVSGSSTDSAFLSDQWDGGTVVDYGPSRYELASLEIQAPSIEVTGIAKATLHSGAAFSGSSIEVRESVADLRTVAGWAGSVMSIKADAAGKMGNGMGVSVYEKTRDAAVSLLVQKGDTYYSGSGYIYRDPYYYTYYIVTVAHNVIKSNRDDHADHVWAAVPTADGAIQKAVCNVVGVAGLSDIAVLQFDNARYPPKHGLAFAAAGPPPGEACYVVGDPQGIDAISISEGVVRDCQFLYNSGPSKGLIESLSVTCAVYAGNSGSPIVNADGDVIGIVSYGTGTGTDAGVSALSWGASVTVLAPVVDMIIGTVANFVGHRFDADVSMLDMRHSASDTAAGTLEGIFISSSDGSDINSGDIILEVGGEKMGLYGHLGHATPRMVYLNAGQGSQEVKVLRNGSESTIETVSVGTVAVDAVDDIPLFTNGAVSNAVGITFKQLSQTKSQ